MAEREGWLRFASRCLSHPLEAVEPDLFMYRGFEFFIADKRKGPK